MNAKTGASSRGRPAASRPRPPSVTIGKVVHTLQYLELVKLTARWRCSCGEVVTSDARHREDAGEKKALQDHIKALTEPKVIREVVIPVRSISGCPICGADVRPQNMERHMRRAHSAVS